MANKLLNNKTPYNKMKKLLLRECGFDDIHAMGVMPAPDVELYPIWQIVFRWIIIALLLYDSFSLKIVLYAY